MQHVVSVFDGQLAALHFSSELKKKKQAYRLSDKTTITVFRRIERFVGDQLSDSPINNCLSSVSTLYVLKGRENSIQNGRWLGQ